MRTDQSPGSKVLPCCISQKQHSTPHWNAPELARIHHDLEAAYRRLPESDDGKAHEIIRVRELVEDLDWELGELGIATASETTVPMVPA